MGAMLAHLEGEVYRLKAMLAHLEAMLAHLGSYVGPCWSYICWPIWRLCWHNLDAFLRLRWAMLTTRAENGKSRKHCKTQYFSAVAGCLKATLTHLAYLRAMLSHFGGYVGPFWWAMLAHVELSFGYVGLSFGYVGPILALCCPPLDPMLAHLRGRRPFPPDPAAQPLPDLGPVNRRPTEANIGTTCANIRPR